MTSHERPFESRRCNISVCTIVGPASAGSTEDATNLYSLDGFNRPFGVLFIIIYPGRLLRRQVLGWGANS